MYLQRELVPSEASRYAIALLGWIICFQISTSVIVKCNVVIEWLKIIIRCSEEEQSVLIRKGAIESLRVSRSLSVCQTLLDNPSENGAPHLSDVYLQCWIIALRLMQDDDEDIRDIAVGLVVETLSSGYVSILYSQLYLFLSIFNHS